MTSTVLSAPPRSAVVPPQSLRPVALWLLVCCALVFAIVVVGGVTRLTRSGLSIVEWQPIAGVIPPFSQTEWQETFLKYQQTPEFTKVNHAMTLAEFKGIFWWEYVHRLLGRVIGAVFLLPLVWFSLQRRISRHSVGLWLACARMKLTGKPVSFDRSRIHAMSSWKRPRMPPIAKSLAISNTP